MKLINISVMLFLIVGWTPSPAKERSRDRDIVFQVSTLSALLAGDYYGKTSFRKVMKRGDFGLGTFAALDGEMVAADGIFY